MDRGDDQIIFVQPGHARLITGATRWIKCQLGKESFSGGISGRDLFELDKIFPANNGIFVNTVKMRLVPETSALQFGGPTGATCTQILNGRDEGSPVFFANPRWHWRIR